MSNFKYSILLFVLFVSPIYLKAQDKFGYVNAQELLVIMPEYKAAEDNLKAYAQKLHKEYLSLQSEYEARYSKYERLIDGPAQSKEEIEKDIVDIKNIERRMQCLEEGSEQILINQQEELLKPIIEELHLIIRMVAKEHGYTYVFDSNIFDVISIVPQADDITPLIMQHLQEYWFIEKGSK